MSRNEITVTWDFVQYYLIANQGNVFISTPILFWYFIFAK